MYDTPEEMIGGLFSYERRTCRSLRAAYYECVLYVDFGKFRAGTPIDEVMIDYETGYMEFIQNEAGKKTIGEYALYLSCDELSPEPEIDIVQEVLQEQEPPQNFMDAEVALAMLEPNIKRAQQKEFGIPDLSYKFGMSEEDEKNAPRT